MKIIRHKQSLEVNGLMTEQQLQKNVTFQERIK